MENLPSFETPEIKAAIDKYYPVLAELRRRIVITLLVFAIATGIGFFYCQDIIKFVLKFLSIQGVNVVFTSPFQFINLSIATGVAVGIIFSVPILIFQVFAFLRPALAKKEYRAIMGLLPFSLILFVSGFIFGALIMKWQIEIFLANSVSLGIGNFLDVSHLLTTVIITAALMGVSFQFPIILLLLLRLGLVKPKFLSKIRPFVYLGSFIFAILLPPDSIVADVLLSLPLIILFEVTLVFNRLF